jgi:ribonucleoside-diphosphate reductase alpha chain
MSIEDFAAVYSRAYDLGMKGCTTYRPSDVRGSVLKTLDEAEVVPSTTADLSNPPPRALVLPGRTYKIKWPNDQENYFLTVNDTEENGKRRPFEIFINTKSPGRFEDMTALTRTISAVCRRGDAAFLFEELQQIHSPQGGGFFQTPYEAKPSYTPSLVSAIGRILLQHTVEDQSTEPGDQDGTKCPACKKMTIIYAEGCAKCRACGYSHCA